MLDEFLEYEEYQFSNYDLSDTHARYRIRQRYIKKGMSSVPRALEIIARKKLFGKRPKSIKSVKKDLKSWLNEFEDTKKLDFMGINTKAQDEFINETLSDFTGHYFKSSISLKIKGCKSKKNKNDLTAVSWDRTIANAYERGPLKKYMLVENENLFDNIWKEDRGDPARIGNEKKTAAHRDFLRKLTAYYIIENRLKQNSVSISKYPVCNWSSQYDSIKYYWKCPDGSEFDLFEDIEGFQQQKKYIALKQWINNYDVIEITDSAVLKDWSRQPENAGKRYYLDKGAFEFLEEHNPNES